MSWKTQLVPPPLYTTPRPEPYQRTVSKPRRVIWLSDREPDASEANPLHLFFGKQINWDLQPIFAPLPNGLVKQLLWLAREEKQFHEIPIVLTCQLDDVESLLRRATPVMCGEGLHCFILIKTGTVPVSLSFFDGRRPAFADCWLQPHLSEDRDMRSTRKVLDYTRGTWSVDSTYPVPVPHEQPAPRQERRSVHQY